jgi:hypothetical protein
VGNKLLPGAEPLVFGVMYFEPERMLSGPDLARIWALTNVFGNRRASGDFTHLDCLDASKSRSFRLGSLEFFQPLLDVDDRPIEGAVQHNLDFFFSHVGEDRSWDYDTLPDFMMGVSVPWFEKAGTAAVLETYKQQFEICDRYAPRYGLIDISAPEDCEGGDVYTACWPGNARLHRWAEDMKFRYACSHNKPYARGVYWGNYFGPAILERLGGRDRFVKWFRESAVDNGGSPNALIWEFTNGVFVSLCTDPLDCTPGPPLDGNAASNLHGLLLDLGAHGVLDPWSK